MTAPTANPTRGIPMYEVKTVYCQTFTNFVATAKEAGAKVKKSKGHAEAIVPDAFGTIGHWDSDTKRGYITFYEKGCSKCGLCKIGQEGDQCEMCADGWRKVDYKWPEGLNSTLVAYAKLENSEDPEMMLRVLIEVDEYKGTLECVAGRTEPACPETIIGWLIEEGCLPTEDEELNGGDGEEEEDDDDADWDE